MIRKADPTPPGLPTHRDGLDTALVTTVAILLTWTAAMLIAPNNRGHVLAPAADLLCDTTALVVTGLVAVLSWVRYRESRQQIGLYQAAAFLALTVADATAVAVAIGAGGAAAGSSAAVGQAQLFVWTVARLLAAGLLAAGGAASLRGSSARHPLTIVLAPAALMLAMVALVQASGDGLPSLLATIVPGASPSASPELSMTPFGAAALGLNAALFLRAAWVRRQISHRNGAIGDAYVAVGLVIAAFAQLHVALFPSIHPREVASSDLLVLAFGVVLFLGIAAEARFVFAALRRANQSLELMRDSEVDRAALEERSRLSRELHDGLAQDLWLAKLKVGRLAALPDLGPEAIALCEELTDAIDSGLSEARRAVMALRLNGDGSGASLSQLIRRTVDDFQDRFGLRAELECADDLPRLRPRVEAELLRIAQEALSNVNRHADATLVRLQVRVSEDQVTLTIRDNGKGFDPTAVGDGSFGLVSMRERATLVGGRITIESLPSDGTCVTVAVPVLSDPDIVAAAR